MATTRGFLGRRKERDPRLPPGQYDVGAGWPVLTAEATPRVDAEKWSVTVDGLVDTPKTWSLRELRLLPPSVYAGDVVAVHTGGGSSDPARRLVWLVAARLRYARKWRSHPGLLAASLRAASVVNLGANALRALAGRGVRPLAVLRGELRLIAAAERAAA